MQLYLIINNEFLINKDRGIRKHSQKEIAQLLLLRGIREALCNNGYTYNVIIIIGPYREALLYMSRLCMLDTVDHYYSSFVFNI